MLPLLQSTLAVASLLTPLPAPSAPIKQAATLLRWQFTLAREGRRPCVLDRDVEVKVAPGKGRGLYAKRDLEAFTLIGRYRGVLLTPQEFDESETSGFYAMCLANGDVIDGEEEALSNFCRFINHSKGLRSNCQATDVWESSEFLFGISCNAVSLETVRDVKAGEELLFDYGPEYWDKIVPRYNPKRLLIDYF